MPEIAGGLKAMEELLDYVREQRRVLGLPPTEPPVPPTMAEWKEAQDRSDDEHTERVIIEHAGKNDLTDWMDVWYGNRPNHKRNLPRFAILTSRSDCWEPEAEKEMAHDIWTLVEWPGQERTSLWRTLFEKVGFECDAEECLLHRGGQRGTENIEVYRGAFASTKRGLSWTTDPERARWFASRGDMAGKGRTMHLYKTVVPADRIYAHHVGRGEDEIVCDVRGLKIEEIE